MKHLPWGDGVSVISRHGTHTPAVHARWVNLLQCGARGSFAENHQVPTSNEIHTYIPTYLRTYIHTYLPTYIHTYIHSYLPTYHYIHTITLHYITFHYITLPCVTLHYITLHYTSLHTYITYIHYIHYLTLLNITLPCLALHYIT